MKTVFFTIFFLVLSACAAMKPVSLPPFVEILGGDREESAARQCRQIFVRDNFQLVHSIEFTTAGGHGTTVIGVTVRDGNALKCGLMGVEGFVLFEAVFNGELTVHKALPPFDREGFAQWLMQDVQTLFMLPEGETVAAGTLSAGKTICRYGTKDGRTTDVLTDPDGTVSINVYDRKQQRQKSVVFHSFTETELGTMPQTMELTVPGSLGYTLKMTLLRAEKI